MKPVIIIAIMVLIVSVSVTSIYAQSQSDIPSWVKNNAIWWGEDKISDSEFLSALQYLINSGNLKVAGSSEDVTELEKELESSKNLKNRYQQSMIELKAENLILEDRISKLQSSLLKKSQESYSFEQSLEDALNDATKKLESKKPQTTIENEEIHWRLFDSKGNQYDWSMPVETYENQVKITTYSQQRIQYSDGSSQTVGEFSDYVGKSFSNVIDDIYDNSSNEDEFIFEVWYIVSQLTIYSEDIGEYPRYALETLTRGGGDCEDTVILMADMIKSSAHTRNWNIQMVYFDSDNPTNPHEVNHVALAIDTGKNYYIAETTAKTYDGLNAWQGVDIIGWWSDV
jgi:hypothetical protein